ncbi:hypothetical protein FA15DRAFT_587751 [Coprinopsis marcescibilis]|uniref:Uncharacterized protein n=1 Tax=Coprinopsis marcescibilis TaxID=230819 RepID=A0A5C3L3M4_COPMA|nr:hypothetical protein FA15DRAFT_587751 [Coprinopsis marcescibilis]
MTVVVRALMISAFLTFVAGCLLYVLRISGYVVKVSRIKLWPLALQNITYSHHTADGSTVGSIGSVVVQLHIPRPSAPYLAEILLKDVTLTESSKYNVKIERMKVKMWLLPHLFRFTAGPIITAEFDKFMVEVTNSSVEPWWLEAIRLNVIAAALHGQVIRLHDLKTKLWLWAPAKVSAQSAVQKSEADEDDESGAVEEESTGEEAEGEVDDSDSDVKLKDLGSFSSDVERSRDETTAAEGETESRARVFVREALIHNQDNDRMYTMGTVAAEVKRPWNAPPGLVATTTPLSAKQTDSALWPGSFVLRATDCKWTKLPRIGEHVQGRSFFWSVLSCPAFIRRTILDPLSLVDLEFRSMELTFREFRLRDADLLGESIKALHQRYSSLKPETRAKLQSLALDLFFGGIRKAFLRSDSEEVEEVTEKLDSVEPRYN